MDIKEHFLKKALERRKNRLQEKNNQTPKAFNSKQSSINHLKKFCDFEHYDAYQSIVNKQKFSKKFQIDNPYFLSHEGIAAATTSINGHSLINFSSYNYLNLNGDPRVSHAAKEAIDRYGTSASASRLVAGERPIHQELEYALAKLYRVEDALIFVSGHATNVTTIGYLFGPKDLVIHDELIHNSILEGIKLSGAFRLSFAHNNWEALDKLLYARRHQFERVLIVIEGIYSMDGDYPELPEFIEIKKKHHAFLMVDEAHSLGTMGVQGRGIGEFFNINAHDVDLWMGTLSKTLASCGGYIAGCRALVEHLRYTAPGFLYSVGMSPSLAAASLKAIEIMLNEPERITRLHARAGEFLKQAKLAGLNVGLSQGLNIIPVLYKSSKKAVEIANKMQSNGINVQPIIYPAVPDNQARLRFFMNSDHTSEQIRATIEGLVS
ncbi:MAG: aminotransferase class I/II-fold pyridoxal phosphate-dependent enzyme [Legionella sp.]|nr:aminotransferase class I/II-fold pyridoxal phosphate-dependent enzyme [Legionella sp.]